MNQAQQNELALKLDELAATLDNNEFYLPTVNGRRFWHTYPAVKNYNPNLPLPEPNSWYVIAVIRVFVADSGAKYYWSHALSIEEFETNIDLVIQRVQEEIEHLRKLPSLPNELAATLESSPSSKANEKIVTDWFMQHDDATQRLSRVAA